MKWRFSSKKVFFKYNTIDNGHRMIVEEIRKYINIGILQIAQTSTVYNLCMYHEQVFNLDPQELVLEL